MKREYEVGDFVTIRQWDDMENEFGLKPNGSIDCPCSFTPEMKELCGKTFVISDISRIHRTTYTLKYVYWTFSEEMFEQPITEFIDEYDDCDINDFLHEMKVLK